MNKDALLNQPFNYKVLVVPQWVLVSPEAKERIEELRQQGVLIIDKPYKESAFEKIAPDVILPKGIAYTHRTDEEQDTYFLSNQTDNEQTFKPVFRQIACHTLTSESENKGEAIVYNPLTDEWYDYQGTITLPPYGSLFVQYRRTHSPLPTDQEFAPYGQTTNLGLLHFESQA